MIAKKTIINNVAIDKFFHRKIRLDFIRMTNSGGLGLLSNQETKKASLLRLSPIFNVRKLKKIAHAYLAHLKNLGEINV